MTVKNHGARHGHGTDSFEILNHHGHGKLRHVRAVSFNLLYIYSTQGEEGEGVGTRHKIGSAEP